MRMRTLAAMVLAIAVALAASSAAFASQHSVPAAPGGGHVGSGRDGAIARIIADLQAILDGGGLSAEAAAALSALIEEMTELDAAAPGSAGAAVRTAAWARLMIRLEQMGSDEGLPEEARRRMIQLATQLQAALQAGAEDVRPLPGLDNPGQSADAGGQKGPAGTGQPGTAGAGQGADRRAAALERVLNKVEQILYTNEHLSENALAQAQIVIGGLLDAAGGAEVEALGVVEEALQGKARGGKASAGELDILAHVQAAQGKKAEARATLLQRLEANPHTGKAYEVLVGLEEELGEHEDLDTFVSGKKVGFDVRPQIQEGRTLMPIRAISEALGAQVSYDAETRTVTITRGSQVVELQIGSTTALVNGDAIQLDVSAQVIDGRTVVPARFVSENLGLYVSWLAQHKTIIITDGPLDE